MKRALRYGATRGLAWGGVILACRLAVELGRVTADHMWALTH